MLRRAFDDKGYRLPRRRGSDRPPYGSADSYWSDGDLGVRVGDLGATDPSAPDIGVASKPRSEFVGAGGPRFPPLVDQGAEDFEGR